VLALSAAALPASASAPAYASAGAANRRVVFAFKGLDRHGADSGLKGEVLVAGKGSFTLLTAPQKLGDISYAQSAGGSVSVKYGVHWLRAALPASPEDSYRVGKTFPVHGMNEEFNVVAFDLKVASADKGWRHCVGQTYRAAAIEDPINEQFSVLSAPVCTSGGLHTAHFTSQSAIHKVTIDGPAVPSEIRLELTSGGFVQTDLSTATTTTGDGVDKNQRINEPADSTQQVTAKVIMSDLSATQLPPGVTLTLTYSVYGKPVSVLCDKSSATECSGSIQVPHTDVYAILTEHLQRPDGYNDVDIVVNATQPQ
jgi:hypothetical protein